MGTEHSRELDKSNTNAYNILGVERDASISEIKKAFRDKSKILHPDRNPDGSTEFQYKLLTEAYKILTDPTKRKAYDGNSTSTHMDLRNQAKYIQGVFENNEGLKNRYKSSKPIDSFTTKKDSNLINASAREFNHVFNQQFDKNKKSQPNDVGYMEELDMKERMSHKEAKAGYETVSKKLKPKRMFNKGEKFDRKAFNAQFSHYKNKYEEKYANEIIPAEAIEGFGDLGSSSRYSTPISNYNGLMIVGDDSHFGSAVGEFYDYKESFGNSHYNPIDMDNVNIGDYPEENIDPISQSEFNRLMEERNDIFKETIEPEEDEADLDRKVMDKIVSDTAKSKKFAEKYISQYDQEHLDAAKSGKLDTSSYQLTQGIDMLRLGESTRDQGNNRNYDDYMRDRNDITQQSFQRNPPQQQRRQRQRNPPQQQFNKNTLEDRFNESRGGWRDSNSGY